VQRTTKITIDTCFQGSSCVVRGGQVLLSVASSGYLLCGLVARVRPDGSGS
jgi:hypothetical protein